MDNVYVAQAIIEYKSGKYTSKVLVPEGVKAGDRVKCTVVSGYETFATIQEILGQHRKHASYAKTIEVISKSKEDNDMIVKSELFDMVLVMNHKGFVSACKVLAGFLMPTDIGRKCVYEGNDDRMHVGEIVSIVSKGDTYTLNSVQDGKYFVQFVDTTDRDKAVKFNDEYYDTVKKLKERKKLLEERAIWEMLAEKDDKAKELLSKLNCMTGGNFNGSI